MRQPVQVMIYPVKRTGSDPEYLLLRRIPSRGGFWQGVTGGVEGRESLLTAAKRELSEETGLVPSAVNRIDYSFVLPVRNDWPLQFDAASVQRITVYAFVAFVEEEQEPIVDAEEHDRWKWCQLREALELLMWREDMTALKRCDRVVRDHWR